MPCAQSARDQALQSYHAFRTLGETKVYFLTPENIFLSFTHEPAHLVGLGRDRDGPVTVPQPLQEIEMSTMKSLFERQLVPMDGQLAYGDKTRPSREKQPAQQTLFPTIYHNLAAKTATPEGGAK
mgnify:CR=1 FL=1